MGFADSVGVSRKRLDDDAGLAAALPRRARRRPCARRARPRAERDARQAELEAVEGDIALTQERLAELRAEIDALDKDRATLNQSLIETGKRVQALEAEIDETERRLAALAQNEEALRASLLERRDVLDEVLAALQRMGHRPPPAILVRPEDALASVRSAILLGAVVPDLREAADQLASDLRQLLSLRAEMERERDRLRADVTVLAEERARVQLLVEDGRRISARLGRRRSPTRRRGPRPSPSRRPASRT